MGCCHSTERDSSNSSGSSPPRAVSGPGENSTANPLEQCRETGLAINQPTNLSGNDPSIGLPPPTNTARPNQPLRPPTPTPTSPAHVSHQPPPWTRAQLEREREAFFDTRVSGQDGVWEALRTICELVRMEDLSDAQGIMDAMNLTCPHGRLASGRGKKREKGGVYDERGQLYDLPAWVVSDPEDIVEGGDEKDVAEGAEEEDEDEEGDEEALAAAARRKEEKGKGRAEDPGEKVLLRARLSDRGTDVVVSVGMKQKISVVVSGIQEQIEDRRIRLMYLGKDLDPRSTLEQSGWVQEHVVNCLVYEGDAVAVLKTGYKSNRK